MTEQKVPWKPDGIDHGWFIAEGVGSVRSRARYRAGGWWFLPAWLPDTEEHDVGSLRTKALALGEAERLAAEHHFQSRSGLRSPYSGTETPLTKHPSTLSMQLVVSRGPANAIWFRGRPTVSFALLCPAWRIRKVGPHTDGAPPSRRPYRIHCAR